MSTTLPSRRKKGFGNRMKQVGWKHLLALAVIVYCLLPLLYVLSTALQENATLTGSNNLFASFSLANFAALGKTKFWTWALNSLLVSGVTAIGAVIMGACAAYAFSRFRFRGRRATLTFLLLVQMFPQMLFRCNLPAAIGNRRGISLFGAQLATDADLCVFGRRLGRQYILDVRLFQHYSEVFGRGRAHRWSFSCPDLLGHHHAVGNPSSSSGGLAVVRLYFW